MKTFDKLIMFNMAVTDMAKAKGFYVDKLGFKVTTDYRQDDSHWWVSLELPGGGTTITLTTDFGNQKPGSMNLYLSSPDIQVAHKELTAKGVKPTSIGDDLYGPGSGVKWFRLKDPDGNQWCIVQS